MNLTTLKYKMSMHQKRNMMDRERQIVLLKKHSLNLIVREHQTSPNEANSTK